MNDEVSIRTGQAAFDTLYPRVRGFLVEDRLDVTIDGAKIRGYRSPDARSIWIRDMSDMMRGAKYFETDLTSAIDHFADTQNRNGRILDYFTTFPEKLPSERENWTKYVRVPVEADVEYRFVKAVFLAWQATGDDDWMRGHLLSMEAALEYSRTHPWRWDADLGLVKRAYTIDTWDFAYTAGKHEWLQFQIDDDTFWGISHGDNSGYLEAYLLLAAMLEHCGETDRAGAWRLRARDLREALHRTCFNGRFFTHFVKLTPVTIPGVDEAEQLSLSNPMAINRGAATHEMAVAILSEYRRRKETTGAFAEWFSIDPPFPDGVFGDEKLIAGAYANGGIMPLVGGELARAAFEHGMEEYGVGILRQYHDLISERGETYLWYFPDGTPADVETSTSPEAQPTDGWGSSAMLYALVEGLAGVEDWWTGFCRARVSPRWLAAGVTEAEVKVGYAASGRSIGYRFSAGEDHIGLVLSAEGSEVLCHVLLPAGSEAAAVSLCGEEVPHQNFTVKESPYVDFNVRVEAEAGVEITLLRREG
jgi:hypothetical protein